MLINHFTRKQIILTLTAVISLLLYTALALGAYSIKASLDDQLAASRWDESGGFAQVSSFFADNEDVDFNRIMTIRQSITNSLRQSSYLSENENARSYIDTFSSIGTVTVVSSRATLNTRAIGVSGDFFHFHPLELVSGRYFSGTEINRDSIIIDEEAAWQLFGSSDIAGKEVFINNIPHYVSGVIKRESGRLWEAAGLDSGFLYMSLESLELNGESSGVNSYEIVMPNPVSGYAYRAVTEAIGSSDDGVMIIENTARYGWRQLMAVLADTGLRSMQSYAIRFPYWENYARGIEDILSFMKILEILFLSVTIVIVVVWLFLLYIRREWTWGSIFIWLFEQIRQAFAFIRKRKKEEKDEA
ncbi:MAG: ABC transporter permease [Lachnospiraceae bacterium]|jgi:hypothetical protein|nr:ABC transporter permease [Lachnospiraceae bacterium]